METTVDHIDFEKKTVHAVTKDGEEVVETYDKLVLATGSVPISPKVPGRDLANIHFLKRFQDGQSVDKELAAEEVKNVAVIGAGYIGVEIAEAAKRRGKTFFYLMPLTVHYQTTMTNGSRMTWIKT